MRNNILSTITAVALVVGLAWENPAHAFRPPTGPHVDQFGDLLPADCLARLGCTRLRHAESIYGMAFSPDGKALAVGAGREVVLWDVRSGRQTHVFPSSKETVRAVTFSQDGTKLAAAAYDDAVTVWDVKTRRRLRAFGGTKAWGPSVAFSPDRNALAGCDADKTVRVRDVETGDAAVDLEEPAIGANTVAWSEDGRWLVGAGMSAPAGQPEKKAIRIVVWDAKTGKRVRTWDWKSGAREGPIHHIYECSHVAVAPDGRTVAAVAEGRVGVWETATGNNLMEYVDRQVGGVVCFLAGGRQVAVGGAGVIDVATGERLDGWPAAGGLFAVSADGALVAAEIFGVVRILRSDTGADLHSFGDTHRQAVPYAAMSADGKTLVTATQYMQPVLVWDADRARVRRALTPPGSPAAGVLVTDPLVTAVAVSPDGGRAAVAVTDRRVHVWDATSGRLLRSLPVTVTKRSSLATLAFSPDGKRLAAMDYEGLTGCVWDVATGDRTADLRVPDHEGNGGWGECPLHWTPDGAYVIAGAALSRLVPRGPEIHVFDAATGKHRRAFGEAGATYKCIAPTPDGRVVASLKNNSPRVWLWETASGRSLGEFGHGPDTQRVQRVAFSPDGLYAAVCYRDVFQIWELATRQDCRTFSGHTNWITNVFWRPGPAGLVTTSFDTTALIWDWTGRTSSPKRDDLDTCWKALSGEDAEKSFAAMAELQAAPAVAARLVAARLKPDIQRTDEQIRTLIADLGRDDFKTRELASRALSRYDADIQVLLATALKDAEPGEQTERIQKVLADVKSPFVPPAQVSESRMIHLLERVATSDAKRLLDSLAKGDPRTRLTHLAKSALSRVNPEK